MSESPCFQVFIRRHDLLVSLCKSFDDEYEAGKPIIVLLPVGIEDVFAADIADVD